MKNYNYLLLITFIALLASVFLVMGCGRQYYLVGGEGCITVDGLQYRPTMPYNCPYEYASQVPDSLKIF